MIYTKKDYEFYKFLKDKKPNIIAKELVLIDDTYDFKYSSSLVDSPGYYFIKIPKSENPDFYMF